MSLRFEPIGPVPEETAGVARAAFPRGAMWMRLRDESGVMIYVNFLHPVRKLTEKVRRGARITRCYDAAQTPYRRLLASGVLPRKTERQLTVRWAAVNPLRLKLELESAQRTLGERAVHPVIAHPLRSEEL